MTDLDVRPGTIICSFIVHGEPVPWARPRRRGRAWFTEPKVKAAKDAICHLAKRGMQGEMVPAGEAVEVRFSFFFGPVKGRSAGLHAQRPDLDNYLKLVLDAISGVAYADDGQVAVLYATKSRRDVDDPQTIVEVRRA